MRYTQLCILLVLVVCILLSVCANAREAFDSQPKIDDATYTFDIDTPLYIRRNGKTCYYNGKVTALPTANDRYYTVAYTDGTHNPNGHEECTERIHENDVYTGGGDPVRSQRRVLRNDLTDTFNKAFVDEQVGWLGYNDGACYPRKMTTTWNRFYPVARSSSVDLKQAHYEQVSIILNDLFYHTFVNIHVEDVNSAPSVLSDTHPHDSLTQPTSELYLDYNGCHTHPDSIIATHSQACNKRYKLQQPALLQMQLLGSDVGGSSLFLFQQLLEALHKTIAKHGANSELESYTKNIRVSLVNYLSYRNHVSYTRLYNKLDTLLVPNTEDTMAKLEEELMQPITVDPPPSAPNYTHRFNRLYLLPLIRDPDTTTTNTTFLSDHDSTVSVGNHNDDITAEVSFAAKQSTTTTRLAFHPQTSDNNMRSNTLHDKQTSIKDRYYLSVWLHTFCTNVAPQLLKATSHISVPTPTTPSPLHYPMPAPSVYILHTVQQLFSVLADVPVSLLMKDPLFEQWKDTATTTSTTAATSTHTTLFKQLFSKYIESSAHMVNKAEWQYKHIIGPCGTNQKNVRVEQPWNNLVFGVSYTPHYGVTDKYSIIPYKNQSFTDSRFEIRRTDSKGASGWDNLVVVHMNKRIQVMNVLPTNYMDKLLIGDYHFGKDAYYHLNNSPMFATFPNNIRTSYDNNYYNTMKYKSHTDDKCYTVDCIGYEEPPEDSHGGGSRHPARNVCCAGTTDVSLCQNDDSNTGNVCTDPPRPDPTNASGQCHTIDYDTNKCEYAFSQMIQNCRNGLLIIEPNNELVGLVDFWTYITHPTESGVRLRLLSKTVKTLVLQVHEFGQDCFTQLPSLTSRNTSATHLDQLHLMQRALTFLYKYYMVIGLQAPASASVTDNAYDATTMGITQDTIPHEHRDQTQRPQSRTTNEPMTVYQSYKCVNIVFRRLKENEKLFCYYDDSHRFYNLGNLRYFAQANHQDLRSVLTPLVHPVMLNTITAMKWHDVGYTHNPKERPIHTKATAKEKHDKQIIDTKSVIDRIKMNGPNTKNWFGGQ